MSNILDGVMESLGADGINAIAGRLGIDPATADQAIKSALPLLVGSMAKNSSTQEGADALHKALQAHVAAPAPQQQAQQVAQGDDSSLLSEGSAILGHLLGDRQDAAASGVSQVSGVDKGIAGSLLSMLAPMVMSYVGSKLVGSGQSSSQMSSTLGQEASGLQAGGLGSLLGSVLGGGSGGGSALGNIAGGLLNAFAHK